MKKHPKIKLEGVKKKDLPDYVIVNGVYYEKLNSKSVNIEIDLDDKHTNIIKERMKKYGFVNEAEVIRDVIRRKVFPDV